MSRRNVFAVLVCLLFATSLFAGDFKMKEGKWDITMEFDMPGMPVKMKPMTMSQCLTKEDVADPNKSLPKGNSKNDDCKVSETKVEGNKVTWTVKCKEQNVTSKGEMTYAGDSYKGTIKTSMEGGFESTMKLSGKRAGDCTK